MFPLSFKVHDLRIFLVRRPSEWNDALVSNGTAPSTHLIAVPKTEGKDKYAYLQDDLFAHSSGVCLFISTLPA